jgi:putative membrane protein
MFNPMTGWGMGFGAGWGMGFGGPFMILTWALVIAAIIVLVKWLADRSTGGSAGDKPPLEILRERYARGEIDRQEYEQKKRELEAPA